MRKMILLSAAFALMTTMFGGLSTPALGQNVITNGDFENQLPPPAPPFPATTAPPWTYMSIGAWGTNHGPIGGDPAGVGSWFTELGKPGYGSGGIYQTFNTVVGDQYTINFWGSGYEGGGPAYTAFVAVGSGTWDGTVTDPGGVVDQTVIPSNELAAQTININRSLPNTADNNLVDGWNYFSGYTFTATNAQSTISFWNNAGNAAQS